MASRDWEVNYEKSVVVKKGVTKPSTRPASPNHPYDEEEVIRYGGSVYSHAVSKTPPQSPSKSPPHSPYKVVSYPSSDKSFTPSYVQGTTLRMRADEYSKGTFDFLGRNTIQFTGSDQSNTVFIDFAFASKIWRVDFKFFHDESHQGTTADFGIVNSSFISKFYTKWLYNNPEVVAYYICKSEARLCVGTNPKTLLSNFNIRSGSEIGVEVDMDSRLLRFYHDGKIIPFTVRVPVSSVHVGFSGRFRQAFKDITLHRIEKGTIRPQDKLEVLNWTGQ